MERAAVCASAGAGVLSALVAARMDPQSGLAIIAFVLVLVLTPLIVSLAFGDGWLPGFPGIWLGGAGLVLVALGALATVSPGNTIDRSLEIAGAVITFLAIARARDWSGAPVVTLAGLTIAGLLVAVVGGNEYAAHARVGDYGWRVFSTFYNPGFLAGFLVLTIPASLGLLVWVRTREYVVGVGFASLIQMLVLSLSGARAGVLALAAGLVVFAALGIASKTIDRAGWVRLAVVIGLAIALGAVVGRPTSARMEAGAQEAHSLAFRVYTWKAALQMIRARPVLGFGPGTFSLALPRYEIAGYTRLAHSVYLQAAVESGLPGSILVLAAWVALLGSAAWRLARRQSDREIAPLVIGALAACAATTARGVFDSDWWCLPILLGVASLTGVAACGCSPSALTRSRKVTQGAAVILGIGGIAGLIVSAMCIQSRSDMDTASALATRADASGGPDYQGALDAYESAASAAPWYVTPRLRALEMRASDSAGPIPDDITSGFVRLERIEPTNPRVPGSLAALYFAGGNDRDGLRWVDRALALEPKSPQLLLQQANALERLGRHAQALRVWHAMVQVEQSPYGQVRAIPEMVDPAYAWAHTAIGNELLAQSDRRGARIQWEAAKAILTRYFLSLKNLRPVLQAAGLLDPQQEQEARSLLNGLNGRLSRPAASIPH